MMNSDVSNAAASHSQGPTPGRMGDVSEPSCPESGLGVKNFHQQDSFSDFGFDVQVFQQGNSLDAMQPSSEQLGDGDTAGPEISAAKGFRGGGEPDLRPSVMTCPCLEVNGQVPGADTIDRQCTLLDTQCKEIENTR